jgi:GTP 3',8-cyclase
MATASQVPAVEPEVLAYPLGDALYLNISSACTLACTFCPKIRDGNWMVGGFNLRLARPPDLEAVWTAASAAGVTGRSEVVFTGLGECTTRLPLVLELTRRLKAAGVARVRVDTDGLSQLRTGRDTARELAEAGVSAVSVSLNAPDGATYARLCPSVYGARAHEAVLGFLRAARACLPEVTASVVAVPGLDLEACRRLTDELGVRLRVRPYDLIGRAPQTGAPA